MKTRPQLLLLAGGTAVALGACATLGLRQSGVTFHEAYVEIHPGTNISPEDQKALDKILRQYDSSLYKIRRTENGRVTTGGRLKDVLIENTLLADVSNAAGAANSVLQIGTRAHPDQTIHPNHNNHPEHTDHPTSTLHQNHPQHNDHPTSTLHQDHPQQIGSQICGELVNRVTPILKKYSHD